MESPEHPEKQPAADAVSRPSLRRSERVLANAKRRAEQQAEKLAQLQRQEEEMRRKQTARAQQARARQTKSKDAPRRKESSASKRIVKLRYANTVEVPELVPIGGDAPLFWARCHLREFFFRFDLLVKLPARYTPILNNPLEPWPPKLFKAAVIALLRLLTEETVPTYGPETYEYLSQIERTPSEDEQLWGFLRDYVEGYDAYVPEQAPTTELEKLELVRRLLVLCTSTPMVKDTLVMDVEELKGLQADTQAQIREFETKLKADSDRVKATFYHIDRQTYADKLQAVRAACATKILRAQQEAFRSVRKFNLRTAPLGTDAMGNTYWALQQKGSLTDWGTWVICELAWRPADLSWTAQLSEQVAEVIEKRDQMVAEKRSEQAVERAAKRRKQSLEKQVKSESVEPGKELDDRSESHEPGEPNGSGPIDAEPKEPSEPKTKSAPKRKYPRLKIVRPEPLSERQLHYVAGKENLKQLAQWIAAQPGNNASTQLQTDLLDLAHFVAAD